MKILMLLLVVEEASLITRSFRIRKRLAQKEYDIDERNAKTRLALLAVRSRAFAAYYDSTQYF